MDNVGHLKTMKDFGQFSKADRKEFAKNWKDMRDAWSEKSKAGSTTDQPAKVKATEVLKTTVAAASQEVSKLTDKQVLSDPKTSLADLGENLGQTVEKVVKAADAAVDHAKDRVEEVTDKVRNSVSQALGRVGGLIADTGEIKAGVTEEDAREGSVNAVSYARRAAIAAQSKSVALSLLEDLGNDPFAPLEPLSKGGANVYAKSANYESFGNERASVERSI